MRWVHAFFFGNYFYGLCAVGLSVEASLQQLYPLNAIVYYVAVFFASVLFYTAAYVTDKTYDTTNQRSVWYAQHHRIIRITQLVFAAILLIYGAWLLATHYSTLLRISTLSWILMLIFPLSGALYYGLSGKGIGKYNLRRIGWLKPFVIGFTWGGVVTVYPLLFHHLENGTGYQPTLFGTLLFIKNFMFITVLCIMFDIKDYAVDHNLRIKTFVVVNGLRYTIFAILLPLSLVGLGVFLFYAVTHHFHPLRIVLNTIPFLALMSVAYSMHRRRSIFYYLAIIDGLMLLKAVCGIAGMQFL